MDPGDGGWQHDHSNAMLYQESKKNLTTDWSLIMLKIY